MNFFKRASTIISEEGIITFFKKVLTFCTFSIFEIRRVIIFELDLEHLFIKIVPPMDLSFRLATVRDIESMDYDNYNYNDKAKDYSIWRLEKGDRCILSLHNDQIVGYTWIMKDYMELSKRKHIGISENRVYTYNGFVLREYRRKRIFAALDLYVTRMLKKENKRYRISIVAQHNKAAINSREKMGFKKLGEIVHIKFLGVIYPYIQKEILNYLITP